MYLKHTLKGLAYDVFKDTYKIYADGEKVVSGSWSENPNVSKKQKGQ